MCLRAGLATQRTSSAHRGSTACLRPPQASRQLARAPSAPSEALARSAPGWAARWAAHCSMQALHRRPLQPRHPTGISLTTSAWMMLTSLCTLAHPGHLSPAWMAVSRRLTGMAFQGVQTTPGEPLPHKFVCGRQGYSNKAFVCLKLSVPLRQLFGIIPQLFELLSNGVAWLGGQ